MLTRELPSHLKPLLPKTDTRLRPDQRLYEEGRIEEAEKIKQKLEQKQRELRKSLEASGKKWVPQWFELCSDPYSETGNSWKFNGRYWKSRGTTNSLIDIF